MSTCKPFVKWAGGKKQLLQEIVGVLPSRLNSPLTTFIEPFTGGGAVAFWVLGNCPDIGRVIINDTNKTLMNAYHIIRNNPMELIKCLGPLDAYYNSLESEELKKAFYLEQRDYYNSQELSFIREAALFIFLNKTCFNGLYRVNKDGGFNVPFGKQKNPVICNDDLILTNSKYLQDVEIMSVDFTELLRYADENTVFYLDPPYKPLTKTASFTAYSKESFLDEDQVRLKEFCDAITEKGSKFVLSNSDMKNINDNNNYFDDLYQNYNIKRVQAKRSINSNGEGRSKISEILVTNFSERAI